MKSEQRERGFPFSLNPSDKPNDAKRLKRYLSLYTFPVPRPVPNKLKKIKIDGTF